MAVALSSSDREVIERSVFVGDDIDADSDLESVFEVDRCVAWIKDHNLRFPTLQFPDSLLRHSSRVAQQIQSKTNALKLEAQVSILGDTSYGECCVDEVAAQHIGSDGVIHFGNSCLTPTQRLPVLLVFTRLNLNVNRLLEELKSQMVLKPGQKTHLFYDVRFHHCFIQKQPDLNDENLYLCQPVEPDPENPRIRCGRLCAQEIKDEEPIVFCGSSEKYAMTLALHFNRNKQFRYNPSSAEEPPLSPSFPSISKELMKRFYLIEKAKDAQRIGILVGTLGVSRYRDIIDRVHKSVKSSGKKVYTFLVGKPNVPKLANFPEIDLFVLVACPENSVVDSKDFMQPVITPYELDLALNKDRDWTGEFTANFHDILPGSEKFKDFLPELADGTDVSLISGKIRTINVTKNSSTGQGEDRSLLPVETRVAEVHQGGGGEFLQDRLWAGLKQDLGQTEVKKAEQGRAGIAQGYEGEGDL